MTNLGKIVVYFGKIFQKFSINYGKTIYYSINIFRKRIREFYLLNAFFSPLRDPLCLR